MKVTKFSWSVDFKIFPSCSKPKRLTQSRAKRCPCHLLPHFCDRILNQGPLEEPCLIFLLSPLQQCFTFLGSLFWIRWSFEKNGATPYITRLNYVQIIPPCLPVTLMAMLSSAVWPLSFILYKLGVYGCFSLLSVVYFYNLVTSGHGENAKNNGTVTFHHCCKMVISNRLMYIITKQSNSK